MTNYEKELKEITVSRLAWLMYDNKGCNCQRCPVREQCEGFTCSYDCKQKIEAWLESEVEDENRAL